MLTRHRLALMLSVGLAAMADAPSAQACGGCFHPPTEATVVTDHRMAFSISKQQTILWDQIKYSGDPTEFAWVLPVQAGAKIEVSNDEFFAALDASTQPIIFGPRYDDSGPAACALTGCGDDSGSAGDRGGPVEVLSESVVGPYEQVTLRASESGALRTWLQKNAFVIPASIEPTVDAYVREGFDFIALKLRPECGERSMRPVRVITPGADPTLPLRMVAAGVGASVGITLYVITEGRYRPQNFPSATIDDRDLRWDRSKSKSNYDTLSNDVMRRAGGLTWLIEYADKPDIPMTEGWRAPAPYQPYQSTTDLHAGRGLGDLYYGLCKSYRSSYPNVPPFGTSSSSSSSSGSVGVVPCPQVTVRDAGSKDGSADAGSDAAADAGSSDGGTLDGGSHDAGTSQSPSPTPTPTPSSSSSSSSGTSCAYLDDLDVALGGLHRGDVWVTRLRSLLPVAALSTGDLRLEPARAADGTADTAPISNFHWTPHYTDESPPEDLRGRCAGAPVRARDRGRSTWAIGIALALGAASWIRRRRR
jgi:hypothetical protein